jgi:hypothetical protein
VRIPPDSPIYGISEANNVLEFLALAINLWTIIKECETENSTEDCILILGDSTSALGWLYKTRFITKDSFYYRPVNLIARQIARMIIQSTHCIASQHIKGELNIVADLLSYGPTRGDKPNPMAYDDPDNTTLTHRFHAHLPQFIPSTFEISPLPDDILSFVILALQTTESSYTRNKKGHTRTETGSGEDGKDTAEKSDSPITTSSITYPQTNENSSPDPSWHYTGQHDGINQDDMLGNVKSQWLQTLSEMPQAIWLRRFGTISNKAPFTSRGARGFYSPSSP